MPNKKILLIIWMCFSLVFVVYSCNDTDTAVSTLPNCEDGILNNGEREVDCGGKSCLPCPAVMNATVEGTSWNLFGTTLTSQFNTSNNSMFISGSDSAFRTISLIHTGSFWLMVDFQ